MAKTNRSSKKKKANIVLPEPDDAKKSNYSNMLDTYASVTKDLALELKENERIRE